MEMNSKKGTSLNNIVCKAESAEHGAEIIKAFKALGIDTKDFNGNSTVWYTYGLIGGRFYNYDIDSISEDIKIVTLQELQAMANNEVPSPELTFPREMYVWNDEESIVRIRNVITVIENKYQALHSGDSLNNLTYSVCQWDYTKEIPETVKMTLEQIEEKLGYKIEIVK